MKKVAAIGTSCPDHFLRTKRLPMVLPPLSDLIKNENKIHSIVKTYLENIKKHTQSTIIEIKAKDLQT